MRTLDIAINLYLEYAQAEEIIHYYGLLAQYGLCQAAKESRQEELIRACRTILERYPDQVRHPHYNFASYRMGGNARAWSMMTGLVQRDDKLLDNYARKTLNGCKGVDGLLCMPGMEEKGAIWIDTVTAVTPFMLFAGLVLDRKDYMDFAAEQCFGMYDVLLDEECGLLHQCRGFLEDKDKCSQDHWSRGNGWGYLGLAELVQYLPEDSVYRAGAEKRYLRLSKAILRYQTPKGLWRQEMTVPLSWEESSGSGLFVYGLGVGIRLGLLAGAEYQQAFERGFYGLLRHCINDDFSTERSCPGSLCPGTGEGKGTIQAYMEMIPEHNEHHSFGALMLAMVEASRNGIREVDWMTRREN